MEMENTDSDIPKPVETEQPKNMENCYQRKGFGGGRIWVPIGFLLFGSGLLVRQMGLGIPSWIFSWQMLLIGIGIISGLAHAFRGPGWLILILVGTFFLLDDMIPGLDIHRFIWPAIIILIGLVMLIRPKKPHWMTEEWQNRHSRWGQRDRERWERRRQRRGYPGSWGYSGEPADAGQGTAGSSGIGSGYQSRSFSSEDFIDATTVFGGIHKNILSKNFKGGDVTIFMGGAELNLSQADIIGTATLDITQIMGGTKIIVPANWVVRSELTSVFGNIEDKRQNIGVPDPSKVLIIDGSSVFGGIEIRNY
jgi:predicted membrane protein